MCVQRSILYYNSFWNTYTERRKVPHGFYAAFYHLIRNLLRDGDRYSKHTDIHLILLHT